MNRRELALNKKTLKTALARAAIFNDSWPSDARLVGVFNDPALAANLPLSEPFLTNAKANINHECRYLAKNLMDRANRARPIDEDDYYALMAFAKELRGGTRQELLDFLSERGKTREAELAFAATPIAERQAFLSEFLRLASQFFAFYFSKSINPPAWAVQGTSFPVTELAQEVVGKAAAGVVLIAACMSKSFGSTSSDGGARAEQGAE